MGYKSVITTWKKIQDWVLELLAGMGIGSAYKYDSQTGKATIEADNGVEIKSNGQVKTQSSGFAWINSLGQWVMNLGADWGIFGNYRYGQDGNGHGTWNGIYQRDGNGNNLEVLHSDDYITQMAYKGHNRLMLKADGTYIESAYANHVDQTAIYLGELIFNIGNVQYNNLYSGLGFKNSQSGGGLSDDANLVLKFGNVAIIEALKNSVAFSHRYDVSSTPYRIIRSGRDLQDKAFYTELLMNNRAFLQTGAGDLAGGMPTPPGEESNINNTNSYLRLFYPNGKQLLFYGPGNDHGIVLYYPTGTKAIDIEPDSNNNLGVSDFGGGMVLRYKDGSAAIVIKNGTGYGSGYRSIIMEGLAASINTDSVSIGSTLTTGSVYIRTKSNNTNMIIQLESPRIVFMSNLQEGIKADYKQVFYTNNARKAIKTYYYEYSGTYDAANPQFALYKSQMGSPFTTLDIAGRCRHMHATIKFTNSSNNLNIFNLCDKCYICNSSGDVWVNLNDVTYQMTDGTAYTIFFQFEIEES